MYELKILVKQMQELLKEVEKFEVKKNECKLSLELSADYKELNRREIEAVEVRKQNVDYIEKLKVDMESARKKIVSEPDEAERKALYKQMKDIRDEKDFYEMNMAHRVTPVLIKESREIEQGENFKNAHQSEFGRFSNKGMKYQEELQDLTKKINETINEIVHSHPFKYVFDEAFSYSRKS